MLETALNIPADAQPETKAKPRAPRKSRSGLYGYLMLLAALAAGWLLRSETLVDPNEGLGYWLGILGGSMMAILLLYPAGKKSSLLRRLGMVKHWFRIHMLIGLIGPLLILYHCNFSVGAMNSRIALYSMLGVAISGVIGRYFYARIHRGLYGKRAGIEELQSEIANALENNHGLAALLPGFISDLQAVSAELMGDRFTGSISIKHSLLWIVKHYVVRARLYFRIRREIRARSLVSATVRSNADKLQKSANRYVARQVGLMRQVAQLSFYERLFSLWHIFHMPLFILLVLSALVHVLAVHMY